MSCEVLTLDVGVNRACQMLKMAPTPGQICGRHLDACAAKSILDQRNQVLFPQVQNEPTDRDIVQEEMVC